MLIFQLFNRDNPFFACIAAVFCMKDTVSSSISMGLNRTIGTIIGGVVGIIIIYLNSVFPFFNLITPIMTGLGISISIYICTMINSASQANAYIYAINRSFDTIIGIIIAVLINKHINPPSEEGYLT